MAMNVTLILLCLSGLALHFLGRWSEALRTQKVGPIAYLRQDVPGWLTAVIGTGVCMLLLPDLPGVLGLGPVVAGGGLMKLLALSAGYMGSSIAAKLPALVTGRGTR
jgi:hypothetical protein